MAEDVARDWERMARDDPFWAVLTDPKRRGRLWEREADKSEFYASGEAEVRNILGRIGAAGFHNGFASNPAPAALDVGCGVGRATRALSGLFPRVVGLDFSTSMLAAARENCRMACGGGCGHPLHYPPSWVHAAAQAIPFQDGTFELVYSMLVLQHQASAERILAAIAEIVRVVAPGGFAAFQVPIRCLVNDRSQVPSRVSLPDGEATMLMTAASRDAIERVLAAHRVHGISAEPDRMTGPAFDSLTYIVHRP